MVKDHFISLGIGFFEVCIARWKSDQSIAKITQIEGFDILKDAAKKDRGIVLLSAHFTMLEISAFIGRESIAPGLPDMVGMYRLGSNPIINRFFRNARLKSVHSLVTKFEVKNLIKALKEKKIVWYASDQNFTGKSSVDISFFGQNAPTTPAICRFVEMTDCIVLPYFPERLPNGNYVLTIYPELNNEDCKDPKIFLQRFYQCLESHIMNNREQYYWVHRRFKKEDPQNNPYTN
jgi:KDO2-lipid IV(A) lauroyltransferase